MGALMILGLLTFCVTYSIFYRFKCLSDHFVTHEQTNGMRVWFGMVLWMLLKFYNIIS